MFIINRYCAYYVQANALKNVRYFARAMCSRERHVTTSGLFRGEGSRPYAEPLMPRSFNCSQDGAVTKDAKHAALQHDLQRPSAFESHEPKPLRAPKSRPEPGLAPDTNQGANSFPPTW